MRYKGLEWKESGTPESPEKEAKFSDFNLCVFPDREIGDGWSYEVLDCDGDEVLSGYHMATEERAMREAIFDAMILKLRDFN